ncbi:proto-oncogene tyrosine-protein kinase ROS-like isoform X2 [Anoplolepis gracilipes]|uniref:proto-oncogene tyrosine-protein kinase ROS-like isoform X2 n=1 Tax=Anoplolepis gracilipes TaxID=354296 RepID=UPI003BA32181
MYAQQDIVFKINNHYILLNIFSDNLTILNKTEMEHKIYVFGNNSKELSICEFGLSAIKNNNCTIIINFHYFRTNLKIDLVARNLYWTQPNYEDKTTKIMKLDLALWQTGIVKYDNILQRNKRIQFLNVLPSLGYLYWVERNWSTDEYKVMQSDLNGKEIKPFYWENICFSTYNSADFYIEQFEEIYAMKIDNTNIDKPLIYWIVKKESKNYLIVTDIYGCRYHLILTIEYDSIDSLKIMMDKINLYLYDEYDQDTFYILEKKYALLESKENASKYVQEVNISDYYTTTTNYSIVLNIPESVPVDGCKKYNLATTIYIISVRYQTCLNNDPDEFDEFYVKTYKRHYEIQNLTPLTTYKLKFALNNFYVDKLSMELEFGTDVILETTPGKLNVPENVIVQVLTPTLAVVYWMPPKNINCVAVTYEVHWVTTFFSYREVIIKHIYDKHPISKSERTTDGKHFLTSRPLMPGQKYFAYVRVYPVNFSNFFKDSLKKSVYMYPKPNNLTLSGSSANSINISWNLSDNITHYTLKYKQVGMQIWKIANNTETYNYTVEFSIENLLPGILYKFCLILRYCNYKEEFRWPPDGEFDFKTHESTEISATEYDLLIISIILGFVIAVIYTCYLYYLHRRRRSTEQVLFSTMTNIELATLYEIPYGHVQFNTLYAHRLQYNRNELALTVVEKKQITLIKLVGSGAFGKVFQGTVKNLEGGSDTMPVAIKMLRSNASSSQITEFLREAKLMGHFHHRHLLRLLGICIDGDSPWLILELMEVDLLKYLRESRILSPLDLHALRLQDLLAMCEDIARGCCYLEKLHFVHRDLACRNCLISSRNRENRIVKIGDFGLARDIYKSQYYRMKREGLLPVRWMAPESLIDGIFTSQSDVWAFGVVIWEIMSLGEQPYPAKNNDQVLEYVRSGGKLSKPLNCPLTLYELMQHCWNVANDRPNFVFCLNNIVSLRNSTEDATLGSVDIISAEVN